MLVKDCNACNGCRLQALFPNRNLVPPQMGPSKRLLIGEAAGADEEIEGKPFVGASGRMLDSFLRKAGVQRGLVTIANTLSCRPPDNAYPTDESGRAYCTKEEGDEIVQHCYEHHLKPLLDSRPWERIDAIGAHALEVLTGLKGIMKWRGCPLPLKNEEKPRVMPTLHPMYLMRDQSMIPAMISDLSKGVQVPPQHYTTQPTLEELELFHADRLTFDIETNRFTGQITMVGIAREPYHVLVVPFRGAYIAPLKRIFKEAKEVVGQNLIQFDLQVLKLAGIEVDPKAQIWDIMLMHHLLHPDEAHDLEYIASIYTQMVAWKHTMKQDIEWYNACDVDATLQSFLGMLPVLKQQSLESLYKYVSVPLAKICSQMQEAGIKTDPNRIKVARGKLLQELDELQKTLPVELQPYNKSIRVRQIAPTGTLGKSGKPVKYIHVPATEKVIPWESSKEVEKYLYTTLKLPKQTHPKTKKVTTDKNAIDRLIKILATAKSPHIDSVKAIKTVRGIAELLSTYLKDVDDGKQIQVGRVHSNFLVHGTSTGRLASSGPNLQNIPPAAKYIYVPSHSDWCFIEADFSSLENRIAAHYANDVDRLRRMSDPTFNEHKNLASELYGIPIDEIDKKSWQYDRAKHTNHGCDAGMGARKMAIQYGFSEAEAKAAIIKWRQINHISYAWQERTGNKAVKDGVLVTGFGRKRWFWSHSGYTDGIRFMTQSTGADICFRAMIGLCYERIEWPAELAHKVCDVIVPLPQPARLLVQVHDSLLIECPYSIRHEVMKAMHDVMTQPWSELAGFSIPVAIKCGEPGMSWAELREEADL